MDQQLYLTELAMSEPDRQAILDAAAHSLRETTSIRDFLAAVTVGSRTANEMLDGVEKALLAILDKVGESQGTG